MLFTVSVYERRRRIYTGKEDHKVIMLAQVVTLFFWDGEAVTHLQYLLLKFFKHLKC